MRLCSDGSGSIALIRFLTQRPFDQRFARLGSPNFERLLCRVFIAVATTSNVCCALRPVIADARFLRHEWPKVAALGLIVDGPSTTQRGSLMRPPDERDNKKEIERKFYEHGRAIPPNIEVMTWFGFLLSELARRYAERNIDGPWQRKSAKVLL